MSLWNMRDARQIVLNIAPRAVGNLSRLMMKCVLMRAAAFPVRFRALAAVCWRFYARENGAGTTALGA